MLGAYLAWTLVTALPRGHLGFWGGVLARRSLVGLLGVAVEVLLLRRIYRAPELFQLLATFGVVLIVQDLALLVWGPAGPARAARAGLRGSVEILGLRFPRYELFLIAVGPGGARPAVAAVPPHPLGHCWSAPRRRTARWSARSASTSGGCSPPCSSWARCSPASAARCSCRGRA